MLTKEDLDDSENYNDFNKYEDNILNDNNNNNNNKNNHNNINNNHNDNNINYKGIYFNDNTEKKYYEAGAHFSYKDLCSKLDKLLNILEPERRFEFKDERNKTSKNVFQNDNINSNLKVFFI